jgi:UDP-glucose 4,6-dehydratase
MFMGLNISKWALHCGLTKDFFQCRYYICDKKLASLGWQEKVTWEEGLKKTINWYLENGFGSRWVGDVDAALAAHPKAQ